MTSSFLDNCSISEKDIIISEKDIIIQVLNDLPIEYNAFLDGISHLPLTVTFHGLQAKLMTQEQHLQHHHSSS